MAKKTSKKDLRNYLDFIPVHHEQYSYTVSDNGAVTVYVENKGVFNKIAQVVFKKPRISQIHLDEMGNFILAVNGRKEYDIRYCRTGESAFWRKSRTALQPAGAVYEKSGKLRIYPF